VTLAAAPGAVSMVGTAAVAWSLLLAIDL
jgi:hypothetical protein